MELYIKATYKYLNGLPVNTKLIVIICVLIFIAGATTLGLYIGGVGVFKRKNNYITRPSNYRDFIKPVSDVKPMSTASFIHKNIKFNISCNIDNMQLPFVKNLIKEIDPILAFEYFIKKVIDIYYKYDAIDNRMIEYSISNRGCRCLNVCNNDNSNYLSSCLCDDGTLSKCKMNGETQKSIDISLFIRQSTADEPNTSGYVIKKTANSAYQNRNLYINTSFFSDLPPASANEKFLGIMIHELGHVFSFYETLDPLYREAICEGIRTEIGFASEGDIVITKINTNAQIYPKFVTPYGPIAAYYLIFLNKKFPNFYNLYNKYAGSLETGKTDADVFFKDILKADKNPTEYWLEFLDTLPAY